MRPDDPSYWMWTEACSMIERAERLHRQFFQPSDSAIQVAAWEPPVDVFETHDEFWIVAALPGVEPKDLEVAIQSDVLSIAGRRRPAVTSRGAVIHRMEIPYGRFERRIRLPAVQLTLGRTQLENGCLFLSLSKRM
jgi:HSP20 family protein